MSYLAPTIDTPILPPTYARLLCLLVRGLGVDLEALLHGAGLPGWSALARSDSLLPYRSVHCLVEAALRASGRPWLGLELGRATPVSSHGPLGYACVTSPDLQQALEMVARYGALRMGVLRFRLDDAAPTAGVRLLTVEERIDLGSTRGFILDTVLAAVLRLIESVAGSASAVVVGLDLPFAAPAWRDQYERLVPASASHLDSVPLRFDARHLVIRVASASLAMPCLTADARAFDAACLECEQLLVPPDADTAAGVAVQRVRELLRGHTCAYPTLQAVADQLHLSPRTLTRRLKAEGSSYQALLDDSRQQRALWYLRNTGHSVEEIAARLGYADASNFRRTFRRWSGQTPGEARKEA